MSDSYEISEELLADIRRIRRKVDGFNGPGITNTHDGLSFSLPEAPAQTTPPAPSVIVPVLLNNNEAGTGTYDGTNLAGSGLVNGANGFTVPPSGMTQPGTSASVVVINGAETITGLAGWTSTNHAWASNILGAGLIIGSATNGAGNKVPLLLWLGGVPPTVIPYKLAFYDGSDGSSNAANTYRYSGTNLITGQLNAGPMSVFTQRPFASMKKAAYGLWVQAGTSNTGLWWVDEVINTSGTNCLP